MRAGCGGGHRTRLLRLMGRNAVGSAKSHRLCRRRRDFKKGVVNIPGCPPNPYNFLSTAVSYITYGKFPPLDSKGRPKFAYGNLIHENCERRPHFDAGRFAEQFGDAGHRSGWCLYKFGCKDRRPMPTAQPSALAIPAMEAGRSAPGIPASAAQSRRLPSCAGLHGGANPFAGQSAFHLSPDQLPARLDQSAGNRPCGCRSRRAGRSQLCCFSRVAEREDPGEEFKAPDAAVASPAAETPDEGKQEPS